MTAAVTKAKPRLAIMNAVHGLPVLVARDKGYFREEGLDIELVGRWTDSVARFNGLEAWRAAFRPDVPPINRVVELK